MSTHKNHRRRHLRHTEDGNHHLASAVIGLTAIFLALGIYAVIYANRPKAASNTNLQVTTPAATANQTPTTPTGRTSFVGVVRETNDNRLTIRTSVTAGETTSELLILTTVTPTTNIGRLGELQLIVTDNPNQARTRTPATLSDLTVGTGVEVFSLETIDGQTAVTAAKVDILTPAP